MPAVPGIRRRGMRSHRVEVKPMTKRKDRRLVILDKDDGETVRLFWQQKSPEERLSAVEFLREQFYIIQGYQSVPRMKRELNMVDRLK
jgi:outer membrane biogenesis lipoprotein LolB